MGTARKPKIHPNNILRKRAEIWEKKNEEIYKSALARGLELIELSLDDPTDKEEIYPMLVLKEKLAEFYVGEKRNVANLFAII